MKTIEEAAKDYSAECYRYNDDMRMQAETHFEAGIEFAQRWISVEDELPINQDIVFVKTDRECVTTAYLHGKKSGFIIYGEDAYIEFGNITHWRPIELK